MEHQEENIVQVSKEELAETNALMDNAELEGFPESVVDPATGIEIKFTEEDHFSLIEAENDIGNSIWKLSMSFKRIKDRKLYLLRGYNSFKDYVETNMRFSLSQVNRYLKIADTFGDSRNFKQIAELPMSKLLAVAKDVSLVDKIKTSDFSEEELKNYVNDETARLQEENAKLRAEKDKIKNKLQRSEERLKNANEDIKNYKATVGSELYEKITNREEAVRELDLVDVDIAKAIQTLQKIQSDDPVVVQKIGEILGGLSAYLNSVEPIFLPKMNQ